MRTQFEICVGNVWPGGGSPKLVDDGEATATFRDLTVYAGPASIKAV
jgi:hypothetical protein